MLSIDIAALKEGVHRLSLEPSAAALDLDADRFDDVHIDVRMDYHNRRILVMLEARAVASLICDRTLVPFDQTIEGSYSLLFAPPGFGGEAREGAYEEVRELQPADRELDITDAVRDTLLLAVPHRCVAPEAEDKDIQTVFGEPEDAAVDPRWEALGKLDFEDD